ncbi:MAG: redox-sensing transcriptional repressor Rex [Gemmatimonadota bacterium]
MSPRDISEFTIRRLSLYLRRLRELREGGTEVVSSRQLAEGSGTTPAQVRKDLSLFGSFGKRGRGYQVEQLVETLESILGLGRRWRVALVGAGKIGRALLGYGDMERRGFRIVAAFDTDPEKIGRSHYGVEVRSLERLEESVRERDVELGIIATPPGAAQETATRLVEAGVKGILNFAPVKVDVPPDVTLRGVDVVLELEGLSFALTDGAAGDSRRATS